VLIAGTHSGVGKTTVATGIMAALRRRGLDVGAAKVGPDFIDPGYHQLATGHSSRNLDTFLSPPVVLPALAARAGEGRDILVIEGVMGLFDGAYESHRPPGHETVADRQTPATALALASTAAVALLTATPVLLVVDASKMNQSVAALVHGYATWSPEVPVRAVILNRVGSDAHEDGLRRALEQLDIPVFGVLHRDDALVWRDRHLGLVPVAERPSEIEAALAVLAGAVERAVDLASVARLAATAPPIEASSLPPTRPLRVIQPRAQGFAVTDDGQSPRGTTGAAGQGTRRPRIAVAGGRAFSFVYPDNLERLEEAGAELVPIDPMQDKALPTSGRGVEIDGIYAGGGFPEEYAAELSRNQQMLEHVAAAARAGVPIWAECGGLLWLSAALDGHTLCGVVPATAAMTPRLTLGYRTATIRRGNPVAAAGATLKGHEFHYSEVDPPGDAMSLVGHRDTRLEGYANASMLATYLHLHLGADPGPAERFVQAAATWRERQGRDSGAVDVTS
jgi:cobyrinic acid a,c-diamide synthase